MIGVTGPSTPRLVRGPMARLAFSLGCGEDGTRFPRSRRRRHALAFWRCGPPSAFLGPARASRCMRQGRAARAAVPSPGRPSPSPSAPFPSPSRGAHTRLLPTAVCRLWHVCRLCGPAPAASPSCHKQPPVGRPSVAPLLVTGRRRPPTSSSTSRASATTTASWASPAPFKCTSQALSTSERPAVDHRVRLLRWWLHACPSHWGWQRSPFGGLRDQDGRRRHWGSRHASRNPAHRLGSGRGSWCPASCPRPSAEVGPSPLHRQSCPGEFQRFGFGPGESSRLPARPGPSSAARFCPLAFAGVRRGAFPASLGESCHGA